MVTGNPTVVANSWGNVRALVRTVAEVRRGRCHREALDMITPAPGCSAEVDTMLFVSMSAGCSPFAADGLGYGV